MTEKKSELENQLTSLIRSLEQNWRKYTHEEIEIYLEDFPGDRSCPMTTHHYYFPYKEHFIKFESRRSSDPDSTEEWETFMLFYSPNWKSAGGKLKKEIPLADFPNLRKRVEKIEERAQREQRDRDKEEKIRRKEYEKERHEEETNKKRQEDSNFLNKL